MLIRKTILKKKYKKKLKPVIKKNLQTKYGLIQKKIYRKNSKIYLFFLYSNILEFFLLHKVLNYLMFSGKKDKAYMHWIQLQFQVYLKKIKINGYKFCVNPVSLFIFVLQRANVVINLKKKKVAGRTHFVPLFLDRKRQVLFTLKNYIVGARLHVLNLGITAKLLYEFLSLVSEDNDKLLESQLNKKKRWLYAQAIENKFYIKFL